MAEKKFSEFIANEALDALLGDHLGSGMSRRVFAMADDQRYVVKIEESAFDFQNVREWELWSTAQHEDDVALWLAPCVRISACGTVLVQRRVAPVSPREMDSLPDKVPSFLTDMKVQNWGWLDDRLVCCDYGTFLPLKSRRLVKARWGSIALTEAPK